MTRSHAMCSDYINEDCSINTHKDVGLSWDDTNSCVDDTFGGDKNRWKQSTSFNTFLEKERVYWNNYGANFYPSIVINNRTYWGVFEPQAVFEAVCAGFKKKPSVCSMTNIHQGGGVSTKTVLIIVVSLIVLNIVLLLCYRRI